MLRIGLVGVGHLGKIHAKCINMTPELEFTGIYDINSAEAATVAEKYGVKVYPNLEELIRASDIVDVVTPTTTHFDIASKVLNMGKHLFIEKPLTHSVEEGEQLFKLQKQKGVKVAVGHVERFNPAFLALKSIPLDPGFIEGHRLSQFNPRGTDVSVVYDLMIHDLDIILKLVDSEVKEVRSKRVSILSNADDICNARIEFENGCVVNLTASRMSLKNMRKLRLFQADAYISIDFLEKASQIIRMYDAQEGDEDVLDTPKGKKKIQVDLPKPPEVNAIQLELAAFASCVENGTEPEVTLEDGLKAIKLADLILNAK
jgi:hypothetical protein